MWMPSAPSLSHRPAMSNGLAFHSVFFSSLPWVSVTAFPPRRSIAAHSCEAPYLLTVWRKLRRILLPASPDFSGWNCVPWTFFSLTTAGNSTP